MPRSFIGSAAAEHFLSSTSDFGRDRRYCWIRGHEDARLLPQGLHYPTAFPHHFILLAADPCQRIGVLLLERGLPIGAVVIKQSLGDKIAIQLGGQGRRSGLQVLLGYFGDCSLQRLVLKYLTHVWLYSLVDLPS